MVANKALKKDFCSRGPLSVKYVIIDFFLLMFLFLHH